MILLLATGFTVAADLASQRAELMVRLEEVRTNPKGRSEAERLQDFIDGNFDYAMLEFPEFATFLGHPEGHDRWTDQSFEAIERRKQDTKKALAALHAIDPSKLEGEDRLNYDLLVDNMEQEVAGQRFRGEYLAISQMSGVQQDAARMLALMPSGNVKQYEDILARMAGVAVLVDQSIALLERGLQSGITPPQVTLRDVPQQVLNQLVDDPMESPLLRAFQEFPGDMDAQEQERLRTAAVEIYAAQVAPAYKKLHTFLTETYLPGSRETIGMKDLPDGEAWYQYNVKQMTTTDLTARQIHDIGLSEVKRIRGEMDKVIAESGFEGNFVEFLDFLRTDPQFFFTESDDLLRQYRDIAKRADAELVKLFGHLPRLPYGVIPVPAYAEQSQTTAYYQPGSLEAGRAGNFFANTYDLASRPKWEMEALTLHEAVPGHHFQISIAQELGELPWFRRHGGYTAYIEGWGLYSESLGTEMGFYKDPYSKFGQLTYEMWRAIRLVVDTGMHALGWSREQSIAFFEENAGKAEHDIIVEVDRYIVWPGQALAYKIGELKIKELRANATSELGERFDLRAFHDALLGNGALPLNVLEAHMNAWVQAQKSNPPEEARRAAKER
jgi:uncharacterized protein (DUF885 family)